MVIERITLTDSQDRMLDNLALQTGKTREQLLKEAIERLAAEELQRRRELLNRGFGIWKDRTDLPDFEAMRAECDRVPPPE